VKLKVKDRPDMNPHTIGCRVTRNHRVIVSKHFIGALHRNATTKLEVAATWTSNVEVWPPSISTSSATFALTSGFSAAYFDKFRGVICEITRYYYPQIPLILWSVGVVVLTDNTSKYKEFIETRNMKTH